MQGCFAGPGPLCFNVGDMTNALYYGDNLDILRQHVAYASVDLIYLDPPFNSTFRQAPRRRRNQGQQTGF